MDKPAASILMIEDDPFQSELYQLEFKHNNYTVYTARTCEKGIKIAQAEKPALILLDILMPNMTGTYALKVLKENEVTKNIPIIIFTNLDDAKVMEECRQNGAADYLLKSSFQTIDQLLTVISPYMA